MSKEKPKNRYILIIIKISGLIFNFFLLHYFFTIGLGLDVKHWVYWIGLLSIWGSVINNSIKNKY